MNKFISSSIITVSLGLFLSYSALGQEQNAVQMTPAFSPLTHNVGNHAIHVLPKTAIRAARAAMATKNPGPLLYSKGGSVMNNVTIYAIYWTPPTLQNGTPAVMSSAYQALQTRLITDYPGHGLANNNTQYYQNINGNISYISSQGSFGGAYIDTSPYPNSKCRASTTPNTCITDADIAAKVQEVAALQGRPGGLNTLFMVYTAKGEDVCDDGTASSQCANTDYCGYHSYIDQTSPTLIYAIMPYGDPAGCGGAKTPNNNPAAEAAMNTASHEIAEAITDPLLDAWMTAGGDEIADICGGYGTNTWKSGSANQMWNGHFYELQQEYNNHTKSCASIGP
ncbi:MAG: hypothetical protein QX199_17155 [Methylococcaceae bacterium]